MRVAFVSDFKMEEVDGGAERNLEYVASHPSKDVETIVFSKKDYDFSKLKEWKPDVVVLVNIGMYIPENIKQIMEVFPFVKLEQDYGYCNNRNTFKCMKENPCGGCQKQGERYELYKEIFDKALFTAFYCKIQQDVFIEHFGEAAKNSYVHLAFFDPTPFQDLKKERHEDWALYVSRLHPEQGIINFVNSALWQPQKLFIVFGWGDPFIENVLKFNSPKNVHFLGKARGEDLVRWYNDVGEFWWVPEWGGYPRVAMEAELCGCKLVLGPLAGAKVWKDTDELRKMLETAVPDFYKRVEEALP